MPYRTFLLDPPWPERGGGRIKRGADRHYDVITTRHQMLDVIVTSSAWMLRADDLHVYMWSTDNYLTWAVWLLDAMGVNLHRTIPWVKPTGMGLGQYFRGCHELLLFGTRGRGKEVCNHGTFRTDALVGARGQRTERGGRLHSGKPAAAYQLIQGRSKGPYVEMFARREADDIWDVWGNEAGG